MGFGVKLAPGVRVRVNSRGVRASVGPRAARVHVGSGRTGVSSGVGPFTVSGSVGGRSRGGGRSSAGSSSWGGGVPWSPYGELHETYGAAVNPYRAWVSQAADAERNVNSARMTRDDALARLDASASALDGIVWAPRPGAKTVRRAGQQLHEAHRAALASLDAWVESMTRLTNANQSCSLALLNAPGTSGHPALYAAVSQAAWAADARFRDVLDHAARLRQMVDLTLASRCGPRPDLPHPVTVDAWRGQARNALTSATHDWVEAEQVRTGHEAQLRLQIGW